MNQLWSCSLCPQCYHHVAWHLKISVEYITLLPQGVLYPGRSQLWACILSLSATTENSTISRLLHTHNSTDSKSSVFWETWTMSIQSLFPSDTTKWPAIARPSPRYNSTYSKRSVPVWVQLYWMKAALFWETSTGTMSSLLFPVSQLGSLPCQDHLFSITLTACRMLSWLRCNSTDSKSFVPEQQPCKVSPLPG